MAQQRPEGTAPSSRAAAVEDEQAWFGGGRIQSSERKAKFLRERSSKEFYASLTRRLGFEGGMGAGRAVFY